MRGVWRRRRRRAPAATCDESQSREKRPKIDPFKAEATDPGGGGLLTHFSRSFSLGREGEGERERGMASGLHVEQKQSNRNLVAHGKAIYRRPS